MKEITKETKSKIKTFIVILVITLIFCLPYLIPHKITDSYWNIGLEISEYKYIPLKDGRIIHFLILFILDLLNIKMETYSIVVHYVCLIIYAFAIFNVYTYLIKILSSKIGQDNKKKAIILMGSVLIILNPLTVENFAYIENIIMSLSILIGTIAAKTLHENKEKAYIKTTFLMILAGLCYQGNLNMWIVLSILYFAIDEKKPVKEWIKYFAKIATIVIIVLSALLIALNICNSIIGNKQARLGGANLSFEEIIILFLTFFIEPITIITFGYYPKMLIISVIIITVFMIEWKEKNNTENMILKYLLIVCIAILACIVPAFMQKNINLSARTTNGIGAIIGVSIIYMCQIIPKEGKVFEKILLAFSVIIIGINLFDYYNVAYMSQITTAEEQKYVNEINSIMLEYEKENDIILKNVIFFKDKNYIETYNNFEYNTFTTKSLGTSYSRIYCLNYYTKRNLVEFPAQKKVYNELFYDKDWNEFNKEQVQFDGDTVYICLY